MIAAAVIYVIAKPKVDTIVFDGTTKIMSAPFPEGSGDGSSKSEAIAVAEKGDEASVLEFAEAKDKTVYKIKTKDGKIGYVFSGDLIQVDAH